MSQNPEGPGSIPRLGSRRSSLISIELNYWVVLPRCYCMCCAWLVTMAMHVHCGLGQLSPLPTSGDDEWVAATKHCERAKRSRISNTHRLRRSLQFRYINNQSSLFSFSSSFLLFLFFIFFSFSGDDEWVAATKHCEWAKRSRISDTRRLRWSLQFCYINNQTSLFSLFSSFLLIFFSSLFSFYVKVIAIY